MLDAGRMVIANEGARCDWVVAFGNRRTGSSHHGVSDVHYLACSTTRAPRITFSYLTAGPRSFQHLVFMSQPRLATSGACYSDPLDGSFHIRSVSRHISATDGYHDWNMLFGDAFVDD